MESPNPYKICSGLKSQLHFLLLSDTEPNVSEATILLLISISSIQIWISMHVNYHIIIINQRSEDAGEDTEEGAVKIGYNMRSLVGLDS